MSAVTPPDPITVTRTLRRVEQHFDFTQMFLFGAVMTFPHRVNYDAEFARAEGHESSLVLGPLQGAVLAEYAISALGPEWALTDIEMRHVAPLTIDSTATCCGQLTQAEHTATVEAWLERADGTATTRCHLTFAQATDGPA